MIRKSRLTESDLKRIVKRVLKESPIINFPEIEVVGKKETLDLPEVDIYADNQQFKKDCNDLIDILTDLVDSLESAKNNPNTIETLKKDFSYDDNTKNAIKKLEDLHDTVFNAFGL